MSALPIRPADQIVVGLGFLLLIVIGLLCARRSQTAEGYFLAGRSMPGWAVGFSMMATIVSSMTFLALPAFAFGESNWRNCLAHFTYIPAIVIAIFLFIPFYRRSRVSSAYEYLERRFGLWARLYAAASFVLFQFFRTGIVLYAVSLAIQSMLQLEADCLPWIICIAGTIVSIYTIVGGLQAVIWTDVFQGIALIAGGFICFPIIVMQLPGGFGQLLQVAVEDDKFNLGSTELTLAGKTVWSYLLAEFVLFMQLLGTDQTNVQRYAAAKSDQAATRAATFGCLLAIPTWTYFLFVGTCLYVFVKVVPDTGLEGLTADEVFPRFILTQVPAGLAGFMLTGLFASAMSTLDSSINAVAATVTIDFYKRLWSRQRDSRHYALVGKMISLLFSIAMISTACAIYYTRSSETLDDLQRTLLSIFSGGLLGLFLLGFLTLRVDGRSALVATIVTTFSVGGWLWVDSAVADCFFPFRKVQMPDKLWVGTLANTLLFALAYGASWIVVNRHDRPLNGLTIWTTTKQHPATEE